MEGSWGTVFVTKFKQQYPNRAERRRRKVRRWEHPKMYLPDCIFAPRSCPEGGFGLVSQNSGRAMTLFCNPLSKRLGRYRILLTKAKSKILYHHSIVIFVNWEYSNDHLQLFQVSLSLSLSLSLSRPYAECLVASSPNHPCSQVSSQPQWFSW